MSHSTVPLQQDVVTFAGYQQSSYLGIAFNILLALIYSVIGALSVFQSLSALESNTHANAFETNGTKIRPYFLSVFSVGIISRLLYIIVCLVIGLAPNLVASELLLSRLDVLAVFDYLISVVFLTSYSIVIALWSSTLSDSGSFKCSVVTLLNVAVYATSGAMLAATLLFTQWMPPVFHILQVLLGLLRLASSYFWASLGSSLVDQIKRRQNMHWEDMQKGLLSKNPGFVWHASSNANKSIASLATNLHQPPGGTASPDPLNFGVPSSGHVSAVQLNRDSDEALTASSSNVSSSSALSGLFIYNKAYSASISQLRRKIQILTLACPASLFVSGVSSLLGGLGLALPKPSAPLPDAVWTALYVFAVETVPSIALMYGFWSGRSSFLDEGRVCKSRYCYYYYYRHYYDDQHTATEDSHFRCYTRIY